ncbi:tetratricopeptide repeat protein [Oleiharenicola lentus]|jgi:predicted negative regulator of RcsB-dependent stress response|uniref:Tetratricopeptide repeat protein n=1 Tax=Oleiharenicola lentus TaxID=2508720 RepID=A0A4Q1C6Y6_9BACT|nr:tetratricopeptide repeat protein [Oleiharenicola lentus]RXK54653.1 tetratricopeptide repeat protein [Oleiharenicola lentus]
MNIPPPAGHQTPDQAAAPAQPAVEEALHSFWEKNRRLILMLCVVALLVVIGREGWQYVQAEREKSVQADFARAGDRTEQLATFAKANEGHTLAAIAYLRIADQRYAAGDYRQALENYNKAVTGLTNSALLGRARVGAAMSQLNAGDKTAAETSFKAIGADAALTKGIRAEATYHLASLALEAGNSAEVSRLVAEIGKIEPAGVWSQRASTLLVGKPAL